MISNAMQSVVTSIHSMLNGYMAIFVFGSCILICVIEQLIRISSAATTTPKNAEKFHAAFAYVVD